MHPFVSGMGMGEAECIYRGVEVLRLWEAALRGRQQLFEPDTKIQGKAFARVCSLPLAFSRFPQSLRMFEHSFPPSARPTSRYIRPKFT